MTRKFKKLIPLSNFTEGSKEWRATLGRNLIVAEKNIVDAFHDFGISRKLDEYTFNPLAWYVSYAVWTNIYEGLYWSDRKWFLPNCDQTLQEDEFYVEDDNVIWLGFYNPDSAGGVCDFMEK